MTALAGKTVIFVTHQVEFLPAADMILVLISLFILIFSPRMAELMIDMF